MKRRYSDEDAQSRSDTSSHSMGNVADTEMDVGSNGPPGAENTRQVWDKHADGTSPQPAPPLPPPPTKKKRTRTLTTPHQSAVLHALLAQSRFPTTAMREEVGRSIGLSARKVQVWFQNQRQKARRPRNQGSAAPARPPQYGAFPTNTPAPSLVTSTVIPSSSPSDGRGQPPFHSAPSAPFIQFNVNREYSSHENVFRPSSAAGTSPSSLNSGGHHHLSGPGVPGVGSFGPRFPQPIPPHSPLAESSLPQHLPPRDIVQPATRQMPSREFTFNRPFPPLLQVPEAGRGASSSPSHSPSPFGRQNQYPSQALPSTVFQHLGRTPSQQQMTSPTTTKSKSPFASESRPHTPPSFLVPHRRFESSSRDLPRLQIPPPLHVPDSPHGKHRQHQQNHHQYQQQRSALCYSESPPPQLPPVPQDLARFSHLSERLSFLTTPSRCSSRSGSEGSPVNAPAPLRKKRFDPVREAASEHSASASQGTDTSTP